MMPTFISPRLSRFDRFDSVADAAQKFIADKSSGKRGQLIDELLPP